MFIVTLILTAFSIFVTIYTANKVITQYPDFTSDMKEIAKGVNGVYNPKFFIKIDENYIINYDTFNELKENLLFGISIATSLILLFTTLFLNTFGSIIALAIVIILQITIRRIMKNDYETFVERFLEWKGNPQ